MSAKVTAEAGDGEIVQTAASDMPSMPTFVASTPPGIAAALSEVPQPLLAAKGQAVMKRLCLYTAAFMGLLLVLLLDAVLPRSR